MLNIFADLRTLMHILLDKAYSADRTTLKRRGQWPKPLSRRQRRRQVHCANTEKHLNNAGLFARLPCELRLQIYEYVLGGRQINIVHCPNKQRLAHRCQLYDPASPRDNFRDARNQCGEERWTAPPCNLAPLLRTCRLIYSEAAEILYTKNSFGVCSLLNLASFVCFSRTIRPERLASISSLTIAVQNWWRLDGQAKDMEDNYTSKPYAAVRHHAGFTYPHWTFRDPHREYPWRQLWQVVALEMTGLKELNLRLIDWKFEIPWIPLSSNIEAHWLLPILEVPGLEHFTLRKLPTRVYDDGSMSRKETKELEGKMKMRLYSNPRLAQGKQDEATRARKAHSVKPLE